VRGGFFHKTQFLNKQQEIDFGATSFGPTLECQEAVFHGGATFHALRCEGNGFFRQAQFGRVEAGTNPTNDCRYAFFGKTLDYNGAQVYGPLALDATHIGDTLFLRDATFHTIVSLNGVTMKGLMVGNVNPFASGTVDLHECSFDSFRGTKAQWKALVAAQAPDTFSRDPYLQLERYYQKIGDDQEARAIYYAGRCAQRAAAKRANTNVQWSWPKRMNEGLLQWLTGYGVKTWRLMIWIALVIAVGVGVFWSDQALARKPLATAPAAQADLTPPHGPQKLLQRFQYSLELFIPVIKLGVAERWQPTPLWRDIYAFVHQLLGWLLVPLFVASISGIVRKQ
jgi:hypothetical protein